jgi:hypothetical protein
MWWTVWLATFWVLMIRSMVLRQAGNLTGSQKLLVLMKKSTWRLLASRKSSICLVQSPAPKLV